MKNNFVNKYQLEIKELFEGDYHLIVDDEDLVKRLVERCEEVNDLQGELDMARAEMGDMEDELESLREEVDDLKSTIDNMRF